MNEIDISKLPFELVLPKRFKWSIKSGWMGPPLYSVMATSDDGNDGIDVKFMEGESQYFGNFESVLDAAERSETLPKFWSNTEKQFKQPRVLFPNPIMTRSGQPCYHAEDRTERNGVTTLEYMGARIRCNQNTMSVWVTYMRPVGSHLGEWEQLLRSIAIKKA